MSMRELESAVQDHVQPEDFAELGASSASQYGTIISQDYNPELIGNMAIRTYDKMRKGDAAVRSALRVIKAPLLAAEWYFEPAADTDQDRMVTRFVNQAANSMSRTWIQTLWEALLMLDYGYYTFEKVFKLALWRDETANAREKQVVTWKKWAPRHPINTVGWNFDTNGGVTEMLQNRNPHGFEVTQLPIDKLLVFTLDEEGGNPEGISILRSAYQNWYYKTNLYKIDAIQKERHGIGIPSVELPPNYTLDDKKYARELVRNLRTNEKAGVIRPPGWIVDFIEPKGNQVDVLASAEHHNNMIEANVLAQFLTLGMTSAGGKGAATAQEDIFVKSVHYIAELVCAVINKWAVPELVRYNFDVTQFPKLKVRRIGDTTDMRALSVAIRNLVESKVVTPDPDLESWIRQYLDFPMAPKEALAQTVQDRITKPASAGGGGGGIDPNNPYGNRVPKPADGA